MKVRLLFSLGVTALMVAGTSPSTEADIFNASSRGSVLPSGSGVGVAPTSTENYLVGGPGAWRNFFDFNLGSIVDRWADAASFSAENTNNANNGAGTYTLHRVTEDTSTYSAALYSDIGAGASYGSVAVADPNVGQTVVALNSTALADLNAALGDAGSLTFAFGGTSTSRLFTGSGSLTTSLDVTLVGNRAPTADTDDYEYNLADGGGIILDAQFGTLTNDLDISPYGDSIVEYSWTVNGIAAGTSVTDTLALTDLELAGLGITTVGTFTVEVTAMDEWGATGSGTGSLVAVPEPGMLSLLGVGMIGMAVNRRRRK